MHKNEVKEEEKNPSFCICVASTRAACTSEYYPILLILKGIKKKNKKNSVSN